EARADRKDVPFGSRRVSAERQEIRGGASRKLLELELQRMEHLLRRRDGKEEIQERKAGLAEEGVSEKKSQGSDEETPDAQAAEKGRDRRVTEREGEQGEKKGERAEVRTADRK